MKCLIIAAGRGKRLSARGDSKPLVKLLGISLIERTILSIKKSGITDFYVVLGYNADKVKGHLHTVASRHDIKIKIIINDEWEKGNALSVLKAKGYINDIFILVMCDHVFDPTIVSELIRTRPPEDGVTLAVDKRISSNPWVDMADVTKVLVRDNHIIDIGKDIGRYNAFDTGIFLCTTGIFSALEKAIAHGKYTLSHGIKVLARNQRVKAFVIGNKYWIDVDDNNAFKKAEDLIISNLKKSTDGPISRYINRRISTRISRYLVNTNITPNQISILSFFITIVAALFISYKGFISIILGGILAQIASIIDGCDGEIARLRFEESDFGAWFDAVLDRYGDSFLILALTLHTVNTGSYIVDMKNFGPALFVGFLALIGCFINSYTADKYDSYMKRVFCDKGCDKAHSSYLRLGRDVRIFIIFVFCLINAAFLALVALALVMNIENVRRVVILYNASKHD